jgi:GNAT superfamily N-acetyltransferase
VIRYADDEAISPEQLAEVFSTSGLAPRRPVDDLGAMSKMVAHANLTVTAWDGERLVGVARALTDFAFCCYLSDLAVDLDYQSQGIGRELVRWVEVAIGPETMLLLLSAPAAMDYYPKLGFTKVQNGWMLPRGR